MNEATWLRDVLRRTAAGAVPPHGDRVAGAFGVLARRRRQRLVAASATAVAAVFAATLVRSGGPATTGLEPVGTPTPTVTSSQERTAEPEPSAEPTPTVRPTPTAEPTPDRTAGPTPDATAAPAVPTYRTPAPPPPPLDVYFLVDATSDMEQWRDDVPDIVNGITARLRRLRGAEFMHGFAVFRDFPPAPYDAIDDGDVYERLEPITADGGPLPYIEYRGGGDWPEAHTYALDVSVRPASSKAAGFRQSARKVVVVVSSAPMKQGDDYPTIADTIERLRAEGVAVAFVFLRGEGADDEAREQYRWIAEDTGAVAAEAGTCDGHRRLRPGDPLVCVVDHENRNDLSGLADALAARFR